MREMRDRAAILYVTMGPSGLNIPVKDDPIAPVPHLSLVEPLPKPVDWARWASTPKVETPSMRKYREVFSPKPAKRPPTSRFGRLMSTLTAWFIRDFA